MAKILNLGYDEAPHVETFGIEIPEEMGSIISTLTRYFSNAKYIQFR